MIGVLRKLKELGDSLKFVFHWFEFVIFKKEIGRRGESSLPNGVQLL